MELWRGRIGKTVGLENSDKMKIKYSSLHSFSLLTTPSREVHE